jgi:menaquinone-dependent protoporphyrinogen oxidase
MKNLIIFTTKYGSVEKCSKLLKEKLNGETTIVNLKKDPVPNLQDFDNIILGGSIYIGKIQKKLTKFMDNNLDALLQKRVALFICGGEQGEKLNTELKDAFPEKLYDHAISKEIFGNEVNFDKMNFIDKLALRFAKHVTESSSNLSEEHIAKLATAVNQ